MKSILLTSTALVAFAGASFADGHAGTSLSGSATLGYNDDIENGFYWDAEAGVNMTAALDNGITASADLTLLLAEDNLGNDEVSVDGDYVLAIGNDMATLSFGDVDPAAESSWGGVDGSPIDFFDKDVHLDGGVPNPLDPPLFDAILRGDAMIGGITAALSYGVALDGAAPNGEDLDALQLYASGDFGMVSVEGAYQGEIGDDGSSIIGLGASTTLAGAELTLAYLTADAASSPVLTDETSIGVAVAYPFGPVTVGGYYTSNDTAEDAYGVSADYSDGPISANAFYDFEGNTGSATETSEFGVEGSYDTGLNLTVLAGYISTTVGSADATAQTYVAGVYDLGGGAELLVSYAEDEADDPFDSNDEIGDPEYMSGTTVEVSFSF